MTSAAAFVLWWLHAGTGNCFFTVPALVLVAFCALSKARWEFICRENLFPPHAGNPQPPCPCIVPSPSLFPPPERYSSFWRQQPPSLTRHMFYCPLKHNAPLLFDIELFIYFPAPPVISPLPFPPPPPPHPIERLAALGLLRHDLGGY